jgi:hypothetical protein
MINSNVAAQDTLRATSTGQTSDVNHLAHSVSDGLTENKSFLSANLTSRPVKNEETCLHWAVCFSGRALHRAVFGNGRDRVYSPLDFGRRPAMSLCAGE